MNRPNIGTAEVIKGNALDLPLSDDSVDLIITSPPYFALRSYQDGGEHYDGQIGSEPTPKDFLDALIAATAEMVRVLKPSGSIWVNLGDKYAGSGGHNNAGVVRPASHGMKVCPDCAYEGDRKRCNKCGASMKWPKVDAGATRRNAPNAYNKASDGIKAKSLMGLPWRYAIRCIDELGLILRAEVVWDKPNGLPESVTDRVRRSHETWFHLTKEPRYFAAIDEIREASVDTNESRKRAMEGWDGGGAERNAKVYGARPNEQKHSGVPGVGTTFMGNPLGKLPGSVWRIPSEPLKVPAELGIDHFAAFPTEWPRRIILGWSPSGICVECGEGRRPVVAKDASGKTRTDHGAGSKYLEGASEQFEPGRRAPFERTPWAEGVQYRITGYTCACPDGLYGPPRPGPQTTPARILDPFGGTGTVAMVAKALGRHGISVDLSADYCRLAEWRTNDERSIEKVRAKTYDPPKVKRAPRAPKAKIEPVRAPEAPVRLRPVRDSVRRYLAPSSRRLSERQAVNGKR